MSGHSKWSKVKHQKELKDPRKSKEFSRLSQQIAIAARQGGEDPDSNPSLRKAIEDARAANMPKDNIERAIAKGAGTENSEGLENLALEGYGPGGVAILVSASTDNRNRTISEVRHIFKQFNGSLGEPGSAAYIFGQDPTKPQFRTPIADQALRDRFNRLITELESYADIRLIQHNLG